MKPFKTIDEQIAILKAKGLIIQEDSQNQVQNILKFGNYYNIINGYKDPFLSDGTDTEMFKPNTNFHDIYTLHQLDNHFRRLLLPEILIFETNIKSLIAYHFANLFEENDFYLKIENYQTDSKDVEDELRQFINGLIRLIDYHSRLGAPENPIKHYHSKYGSIPLWVLINFMSFGHVVKMYRFLKHALQNSVAKDFSIIFNNNYSSKIEITSADLLSIMKTANFFRNICAHTDRLYSFKLDKKPTTNRIANILDLENSILSDGNLFTMVAMLKVVRPKDDYTRFKENLENSFRVFQNIIDSVQGFQSVPFQNIMIQMGFPENWKSLI